ncbi:MAG: hypothetical protein ACLQNF_00210 [Thermoplasmata archaeon]
MAEYEWEVRRVPRATDVRSLGGFHVRKGPVAEYAALEFPRESVTWVGNTEPDRGTKGPYDPKVRNP